MKYPRSLYHSPTYKSWAAMLTRVRNRNRKDWPLYGGRGITVCERWHDFATFLTDMGERPDGTSLDRINSDGNYCPENCRWATAKEQLKSRRKGFFKGEKNNQAKLKWNQVNSIRQEWDHTYKSNSETSR